MTQVQDTAQVRSWTRRHVQEARQHVQEARQQVQVARQRRADVARGPRTSPVRELLRRRDFRLMLIGQTVSALGDWMGTIALMMLVLRLSGSTTAVGGVLVLQLLPSAVAAPMISRLVSRVDRRQVMLACDAIRAVLAVLLPLISVIGWVYAWAFMLQVMGLAFLPARDAATPILAGASADDRSQDKEARLSAANALILATNYGAIPFGAGAFALIVTVANAIGLSTTWQFLAAFWIDALTYLVSYAAIRGISDLGHRLRRPAFDVSDPAAARAAPRVAAGDGKRSVAKRERRESLRLREVFRYPVARTVVQATLVAVLGLGALFSLGAVFVEKTVGAGPVGFGALVAMFGVGAVAGLAAGRLLSGRARAAQLRVAVALQGATIISMTIVAILPVTLVGAAVFGAAVASALINAMGLLQDSLTGGARDLALSAFHITLRGGLALSALLAGAAADLVGVLRIPGYGELRPEQTVLLAAGIVVVLSVFALRPRAGEAGKAVEAGSSSPVTDRAEPRRSTA
jgi:predicted MFS family arabinose efflux permease